MIKLIGDGGHAKVVRTLDTARWGEYWICAVGNNRARKKEVEAHPDYLWDIAWHSSAIFPAGTDINFGTVIMAGVIIQPGVTIGRHVIVNTGAQIDHDCVIGDYAHIAPGAVLCGGVTVGEGAQIGCGVAVAQNTVIPPWTLLKAALLRTEPLP